MNLNFWSTLKKLILVLAPMSDVTDAAFRQIIAKYGKPDAFFTEFVSTDGLCSVGHEHLLVDLAYTEAERPIVAQIWGSNPDHFRQTAELLKELGFDGIDINMGCPDRNVCKQNGGAALIKNPKLAQKIILETKKGAGKLPISVKIRLGYNKDILEEWLPSILEIEPAMVTIHGRTKKEMSDVPAKWDRIAKGVEIARKMGSKTLIFGNGDVESIKDAETKAKQCNVDGVMLGRAIFGNPWLFSGGEIREIPMRFRVMIEHTNLFETFFIKNVASNLHLFSPKLLAYKPFVHSAHSGFWHKNFNIMKKHYKAYISGFSGAKELRIKLMEARDAKEVEAILENSSAIGT